MFDFAIGNVYDGLYFSEKSRQNDRLIHSVLETNEDILIFGSSRALHHYNPQIIEDSLGMSCYNVASGGQNIYFHVALLESALERYTPKIAILELMSIDFEQTPPQWDTEKLGVLLPFSEKSEAAKNAVLRKGEIENFKLLSSVYPFNSLQYSMLRNNLFPFNNHKKGFMPIKRTWGKPLNEKDNTHRLVDIDKLAVLHRFVEICKKNDIMFFIHVSPHFAKMKHKSVYTDVSKKLFDMYGIKVINFESDSLFLKHPEYFADPYHLNKNGAGIYTSIVANIIK